MGSAGPLDVVVVEVARAVEDIVEVDIEVDVVVSIIDVVVEEDDVVVDELDGGAAQVVEKSLASLNTSEAGPAVTSTLAVCS